VSEKRALYKKEVKSLREVAPGVFVLTFKRDFKFEAGQVIAIDLVPDGKPRLYSIASGDNDKDIDILFDEKKDGKLTPFLSKLQPTDSIYISEPFGNYRTYPGKGYWIAAGTGIAPFVSMAKSGLSANKTLIHGGKSDENFYFSAELEKIFGDKYIRCCSQQEDTAYYNGRLTGWLKSQEKLPADAKYSLCGSPDMVVQVRDILISKQIPFNNIISETYF